MSTLEPTEHGLELPSPRAAEGSRDLLTEQRAASPVVRSAVAVLLLTSIHHVYGAHAYGTPWRYHVLLLSVPAMLVLLGARALLRRRGGQALARWVLILTTLVVPVLLIGAFEGVYNHVVKDALYFAGAPSAWMSRLFPAPTYEMPDDVFFELTGIAQVIPAAAAAWHLARFAARAPRARAGRIGPGTLLRARRLVTITGDTARVPDADRLVHLQFRRFAGCPVCNLHLRSFVRRHDEVEAAGIREVVMFHSPEEELRAHAADLPFAVVADPDKRLYSDFGVESAPRAVLDPRVWGTILRAVLRSAVAILRGRERPPAAQPHGGRFGLPADFLVARDGRVLASRYGEHADDQWSVDELLALARESAGPPAAPGAAGSDVERGRPAGADTGRR